MENKKRGGARPGAGRKRKHAYVGDLRTVTMRLPQDQLDQIAKTGEGITQFYINATKEKLMTLKGLPLQET